jgi:hypothetical protein
MLANARPENGGGSVNRREGGPHSTLWPGAPSNLKTALRCRKVIGEIRVTCILFVNHRNSNQVKTDEILLTCIRCGNGCMEKLSKVIDKMLNKRNLFNWKVRFDRKF